MRKVKAVTMKRLDGIGIGISALCLVHCLAVPLGTALLPLFAQSLAMPEWVHLVLLSAAFPVAASALWQGWRRHGRIGIALMGAVGAGLLALGLMFHEGLVGVTDPVMGDQVATGVGAMMLAGAHWHNWRMRVPVSRFERALHSPS